MTTERVLSTETGEDRNRFAMPLHRAERTEDAGTAPRVYKLCTIPPQAIVFHCADHGLRPAHDEFFKKECRIESYVRLSLGGSVVDMMDTGESASGSTKEQMAFFIEEKGIDRVVLVGHEHCRWYHEKLFPEAPGNSVNDWTVNDLKIVARRIREEYPHVQVEVFLAKKVADDEVTFVPLNL